MKEEIDWSRFSGCRSIARLLIVVMNIECVGCNRSCDSDDRYMADKIRGKNLVINSKVRIR